MNPRMPNFPSWIGNRLAIGFRKEGQSREICSDQGLCLQPQRDSNPCFHLESEEQPVYSLLPNVVLSMSDQVIVPTRIAQ